ncbi:MAG: hypothetical protein IPN94_07725 [Sphingobacteriales bacterium]|nr:hypothetical protein [Sphingobacteriales bacterium]
MDLSVLPVGSYNFVWSNSSTTEDLAAVQNGTYTVTVTNPATLCSTTTSVTVANNSAAPTTTNTTTANTACLTPFNGAVDLSVLPVGSYNFVWSNSPTTEDLAAVQNGTYTVTVTNPATLCSTTTSVTVANNSAAPTASTTVINNTNCGATGNGSIDLSVNPAGTYAYFWSGGQATEDLSALSAGSYTVTVTNTATLCSATATATISNTPNLPTASTTVINNTNCGSTGNGSIDLSVLPAGTYAYFWSGGQATEDLSALSAGSYTVTVTNTTTLCSATATATLSNTPNLPTASTTVINNTNCGSTGNGSIDLSVNPAGTYAYFWSGGQATEDLSALSAGSYTVTVTNTATLCSATTTASISNNTVIPTASISGVNTYCLGDVASSLTASGGGTYAWNIGGTGTTITPSTAAAGSITYTVTVTSANNCTSTATATT